MNNTMKWLASLNQIFNKNIEQKKSAWIYLLLMLVSSIIIGQHRMENGRLESFNQDWYFMKADTVLPESNWQSVTLPHDWAIEGPFSREHNARTGGLPVVGTGWYKKNFNLSEENQHKQVTIHFDGAMANAHIWVNGSFVGRRPYGYIPFGFDISKYLRKGGENEILVKLVSEDLSSRWYPGAGLYRNVWVEYHEDIQIPNWGTFVTTPEVRSDFAQVVIQTEVENNRANSGSQDYILATLKSQIVDNSGKVVGVHQSSFKVPFGARKTNLQSIDVSDPKLWSLENPYLYQLKSTLLIDGKELDTYTTPFGIREIQYSVENGFQLNGKQVKFKGVCLHHDSGPLGAVVNRRAIERKLEIMKEMGVNAIRTSHNPPSPELLELCDQMGLLVQAEAFDCWEIPKLKNDYHKYFREWYERDLRTMIRAYRNHPSIVMWSIGNEIGEMRQKDGWKLAKLLTEICHTEDHTRPTTAGFSSYAESIENGLIYQVDLVGLNYKPMFYEAFLEQHPDLIVYGSETSSCVSSRGVYHLPMEWYDKHESLQITSYDYIHPPWAYPPDMEFIAQDKYPQVLGEFVWTGFDYLGEPTPYGGYDHATNGYWNEDWPSRSSYFGLVDLSGIPKDRYYLYQSVWTEKPVLHILPHWNWEENEGTKIPVFVYTNFESVELFLNDESLGRKELGKDSVSVMVHNRNMEATKYFSPYRLRWDVPYQSGELKAVGYKNGEVMQTEVMKTAGSPNAIRLTPDLKAISSDGLDISHVLVEVVDQDGIICPNAGNLINFRVQGDGEIAAVGNGDPTSEESFKASYRKAFGGKCMLIVKAKNGETGEVKITATSKGLKAGKVTLKTN